MDGTDAHGKTMLHAHFGNTTLYAMEVQPNGLD